MSLQKLKQQACQLSVSDRLELVSAIIQSLQNTPEINTPGINTPEISGWQHLENRPHTWRKQLFLKERKLLAATVWQDMMTNQMSLEEAAENWDLPITAIEEVICYCESHQELIQQEAAKQRDRLKNQGVLIEPATAAR